MPDPSTRLRLGRDDIEQHGLKPILRVKKMNDFRIVKIEIAARNLVLSLLLLGGH